MRTHSQKAWRCNWIFISEKKISYNDEQHLKENFSNRIFSKPYHKSVKNIRSRLNSTTMFTKTHANNTINTLAVLT